MNKVSEILNEINENRYWANKLNELIPVMRRKSFTFPLKSYMSHLDLYEKFLNKNEDAEFWMNRYYDASITSKNDFLTSLQKVMPLVSIENIPETLFILKAYKYKFTYLQDSNEDTVSFFEDNYKFEFVLEDAYAEFKFNKMNSYKDVYELLNILITEKIYS